MTSNISNSSAYNELLQNARLGKRDECLKLIPQLSHTEINSLLPGLGHTLLYEACRLNDIDSITLLLQHGADVSIKSSDNATCWSLCCDNNSVDILLMLINYIPLEKSFAYLADLLKSKASDESVIAILKIVLNDEHKWKTEDDTTLLHVTVGCSRLGVVAYLLPQFEHDLFAIDSFGLTPIQLAEAAVVGNNLSKSEDIELDGDEDEEDEDDDDNEGEDEDEEDDDCERDEEDLEEDEDDDHNEEKSQSESSEPKPKIWRWKKRCQHEAPKIPEFNAAKAAEAQEILIMLANTMGSKSCLSSEGVVKMSTKRTLLLHFGIYKVIDELAVSFELSVAADVPNVTEALNNVSLNQNENKSKEAFKNAKHHGKDEQNKTNIFCDPGFKEDFDMEPIVEFLFICKYIYSKLEDDVGTIFNNQFSERSVRTIVWCLFSLHPRITNKLMKQWGEIFMIITNNSFEDHSPQTYKSRLILDVNSDPIKALSHPAVAALILDRLGQLGFALLFHVTGQIVNDDGDTLDDYELQIFDAGIDFFLMIIVPRLPAIYKIMKQINRVKKQQPRNTQQNKKKSNSKKAKNAGKQSNENPPNPENIQSTSTITTDDKIESFRFNELRQLQRPLLPDELYGKASSEPIQISMMRYVTETLNEEIISLWQAMDQMLSLLFSPIDENPQRLAAIVQAFNIWSLLDEITSSFPSNAAITITNPKLSEYDVVSNIFNRPLVDVTKDWELVASALDNCVKHRHSKEFKRVYSYLSHSYRGEKLEHMCSPAACLTRSRFRYTVRRVHRVASERREGICKLIDSEENIFDERLNFFIHYKNIVEPQQVIEFIMNLLEEYENHSEHNDGNANTEIHLNRFSSPTVWVESVLQQLMVSNISANKQHHFTSSLSVVYDMEDGIGPGPLKEFFEISRVIFDVHPINSDSMKNILANNVDVNGSRSLEASPLETSQESQSTGFAFESLSKESPDSSFKQHEDARPTTRRNDLRDVPLITMIPLFMPAGSGFDKMLIPIDFNDIVNRLLTFKSGNTQNHNEESKDDKSKGRKHESRLKNAQKVVRSVFESIGILIGYALRNRCPIGVGLPTFFWEILLHKKQAKKFNYKAFLGEDDALKNSLERIKQMKPEELESLELNFIGNKLHWNIAEQKLEFVEVPLLPDGRNIVVRPDNLVNYLFLISKTRILSSGVEESIKHIRNGLIKVIPSHLLSMLDVKYTANYLRGEEELNFEQIKNDVEYQSPFSLHHRVIKLFWKIVEHDLTKEEQKKLMLFWTGNSVIPITGFDGDGEQMVISRMIGSKARDPNALPEASTCDSHLYLPDYTNVDQMRRAIKNAINYSCIGFDRA